MGEKGEDRALLRLHMKKIYMSAKCPLCSSLSQNDSQNREDVCSHRIKIVQRKSYTFFYFP